MKSNLSRRDFLKGAAVGAVGIAAAGLAGCGSTSSESTATVAPDTGATNSFSGSFADTVSWNGQYDVVVVGFGAAGAVSAITAAEQGASVLLIDKAPLGHEGGNTRYCGQFFAGANDYESAYAYYTGLAGDYAYDEELMDVWCKELVNVEDILTSMGADSSQFINWCETNRGTIIDSMAPEYPELPGSDGMRFTTMHDGHSDGYLWNFLRSVVVNMTGKIDIWLESPILGLIQDPQSKTVVGVTVNREGESVNIRANNGVILSCGGFENNAEMKMDYLSLPASAVIGTLYNEGDGIRMAMNAGADLWHMDVYEGMGMGLCLGFKVPENTRADFYFSYYPMFSTGSFFFVSKGGTRYGSEVGISRHGHIKYGGAYVNPQYPERSYLVMDAKQYAAANQYQCFAQYEASGFEVMYADTIAELAEKMGVDADALVQTAADYEEYIKMGRDYDCGRPTATMVSFDEGPYYAAELYPSILNTQGGPRRNARAEVVDKEGNAIPHLYSAGECGGIIVFQYQGGSNIAECLIFGKIAGTNAASAKDDLPEYAVSITESNMKYTLGNGYTDVLPAAEIELGENQYAGTATGIGGTITVVITVVDGVITAAEVDTSCETEDRGAPLGGQFAEQIVANGEIDAVAKCTVTSEAVKEALEIAKAAAGIA
ncbi:MAG: FAD-dependent oxidoreductase [Clostridia bacterium]|nr:FAD-dependent oxidoreductase [Clostridia bacterium]